MLTPLHKLSTQPLVSARVGDKGTNNVWPHVLQDNDALLTLASRIIDDAVSILSSPVLRRH